jgi:hypothetical protein
MGSLRQWFVESIFIAAKVVFVANGARFHRDDIAGLQAGARAVLTLRYFHVDRRINDANYMLEKLAAHLLGKINQGLALFRRSLAVNQKD